MSAAELFLAFNVAQRDVLSIPADALQQHVVMYTLLRLRHASYVSSAWPVDRPLPKRGVAI